MDISTLPAVVDANAPTGVFQKAIGRETGFGGTPSGCFRALLLITLSLATGVVCAAASLGGGLVFSMIFIRNPGFVGVLWVLAALVSIFVFVVSIWGMYTFLGRLLHPNVQQAKMVLRTGTIPLEIIGPALQAREPISVEQKKFDTAIQKLDPTHKFFFDGWFVLHPSYPYALSFGSYLFLSRGAIESNHLDKIIAHELGHLNNGDSFVKCALWMLGKGWFREHMSLAGMTIDATGDKEAQLAGMEKIGQALLKQSWETALAQATLMSIVATGSSLIGMQEELRVYFWQWDIEADAVAEAIIGSSQFNTYLKEIAAFEKAIVPLPLNAPPELRHDRSLVRLSTLQDEC